VKLFKRFFASAAAVLSLASPAAAAPVRAHPALWSVSDADTTVYLFGTIHLLPENYQWRTPRFDQAIDSSQQLVVETIVDDKDPTKIMSALSSLAFSPGLPPLDQRVPPASALPWPPRSRKAGFRPARSTGWKHGRPPSSCSASSFATWA